MCRVFGVTFDEEDEDREADHTSAGDDDDEQLNTDSTDNPTNLFSSATGQSVLSRLTSLSTSSIACRAHACTEITKRSILGFCDLQAQHVSPKLLEGWDYRTRKL